jgi:hypothetical protein
MSKRKRQKLLLTTIRKGYRYNSDHTLLHT